MDTTEPTTGTPDANEQALTEALAWLTESLEPVRLARYLGVLADTRNIAAVAKHRADTIAKIVADAPRSETHADIAARLGCSVSALRNALAKARSGEPTSAPGRQVARKTP